MLRSRSLLIVVSTLVLMGCPRSTTLDDGGGGGGGPCPASQPADGVSCDREGLVCAYGEDPRPTCRPYSTCASGSWTATDPGCTTPPAATCPPTRVAAAGAECTPEDSYCSYDGLACRCTNCVFYPIERCEGPLTWHCDAPNPDAECPAAIPNQGAPCSAPDGKQCVYGCEENMSRTCEGGVWVASSSPGGCPISTRRAKRDIEYVDDDELARLARELLDTRLATYEYTDPALRGRRRLGFILEDQPAQSFAGDPTQSQVDLYGYASMLVATVQTQQRELEAMRRELDGMRRELDASRAECPAR